MISHSVKTCHNTRLPENTLRLDRKNIPMTMNSSSSVRPITCFVGLGTTAGKRKENPTAVPDETTPLIRLS